MSACTAIRSKQGSSRPRARARRWYRDSRWSVSTRTRLSRSMTEGHAVRERRRAVELLPGEGSPGRLARPDPMPDPREVRRRVGVRRQQARPDSGQWPTLRHRHAQRRGARVEPAQNALYSVIHGRDSLDTLFPALYNAEDNATRQAEEFHKIIDGGNYGWPYTFWDNKLGKRVVAPEYGGDAQEGARGRQVSGSAGGVSRRTGRLTICCSTRARTSRRSTRAARSLLSTAAGIARPNRRPATRSCSSR